MLGKELVDYLVPADVVGRYSFNEKKHCLGGQVYKLHASSHINIESDDIVVVGVQSANSIQNPNMIREMLWGLSAIPYSRGKIIDAGNISANLSIANQLNAIKHISSTLAEGKVNLLLIGGGQEFIVEVYNAWKQHESLLRLAIIDRKIDIDDNPEDFHANNFANLLIDEPYEQLIDLSFLGIQGYFTSSQAIRRVFECKHETIRLGNLRGNLADVEPVLYDSHIVSFDFSAIRACDAPSAECPTPNGLYAEEACILARYAGVGQNNHFFGLSGFNAKSTIDELTAMLAAQVLWHYIEGVSHRKILDPRKNLPYNKKYVVSTDIENVDLTFYKNELENKWWFEVPVANKGKVLRDKILVRCSPSDYISASHKDIPDKWLRWYKKAQTI
ncbi:arginase family protein [Tenuifilum thalassicum]|uniref:Formimidoylglutamase n=1 Tax=Tenuifilum thalassicum TaxID=2590900 RepID=A0A7D3XTG1_9BACT|nr:arginase family protein [Tenuifilum thalassicum]QKG78851.1 hypothetical protein FHG85_00730 [Tenuifilum thalassicum]